jgi:DUF971 family protein
MPSKMWVHHLSEPGCDPQRVVTLGSQFAYSEPFEIPMAGLTSQTPQPTAITVHQQSRVLEVGFADGQQFRIPFELMRVYSPSAEVQGHGPGQEVLQTGKREVGLTALEPVGNYAVQPSFSDGHNTGIFSWDYLLFLGSQQDELWRKYESRLHEAGLSRDAPMVAASGPSCGPKH